MVRHVFLHWVLSEIVWLCKKSGFCSFSLIFLVFNCWVSCCSTEINGFFSAVESAKGNKRGSFSSDVKMWSLLAMTATVHLMEQTVVVKILQVEEAAIICRSLLSHVFESSLVFGWFLCKFPLGCKWRSLDLDSPLRWGRPNSAKLTLVHENWFLLPFPFSKYTKAPRSLLCNCLFHLFSQENNPEISGSKHQKSTDFEKSCFQRFLTKLFWVKTP